MKNGTQSKLTLVDTTGHKISSKATMDDVTVEYDTHYENAIAPGASASSPNLFRSRALFVCVSIACAAASVAAASYAIWLSRSKATADALTDVKDLLDTCSQRMRQMQTDLNRQP